MKSCKIITDIVKDIIEYKMSEDEIGELFYRTPLMYNPHNFEPTIYFIITIIGLKFYQPYQLYNVDDKWKIYKYG